MSAFARFLNFTQNPKNKLLKVLSVHEIYPLFPCRVTVFSCLVVDLASLGRILSWKRVYPKLFCN